MIRDYTVLKPFRFWCQKVLPLVYDDSLSYYEVLCKVVDYINKFGEDLTNMSKYLENYFEEQIAPELIELVNAWLLEHPEYVTSVMDKSITKIKLADSLWEDILEEVQRASNEEANNVISSGIEFESGLTNNDFYTIFKIPKDKFVMSLESVMNNPDNSGTIKEYVLKQKPYLAMNISNTNSFLFNGTLYGDNYIQGTHGSIYALKSDSVDFDIFEEGTNLSSLLSQGYISAIGGWNCLRENGVNKTIDWLYSTYAEPNPRQTLAWDYDYWYIYTSYARFEITGDDHNVPIYGKTMQEILDFCVERGWDTVCALDGGGSCYVAAGQPFRELALNVDNGYRRCCHLCITFNEKEV